MLPREGDDTTSSIDGQPFVYFARNFLGREFVSVGEHGLHGDTRAFHQQSA